MNKEELVVNSLDDFKYIGYIKVLQLLEKEIAECIGYDDLKDLIKLYCEVYKTFNGDSDE